MGKASTGNPKFGSSNEGQRAAQAGIDSEMNVGGFTDAQVRQNANAVSMMYHKIMKKSKSGSNPVR
jgi:hypothetical protein